MLKGAHALIECVGGIVLAFVSTNTIVSLANRLTQDELVEDPHDFIASHLMMLASNFSVSTQHFYAFYLLSHGIVKLALVVALLKNKLWAYPSSLIVLGLFEHTAAETNFYSVKRPDGEYIDLIEDWLAEIESAAALRDFKI